MDLAKAVDLYQKAASVFEVSDNKMFELDNVTDFVWIGSGNCNCNVGIWAGIFIYSYMYALI